MARRPWQTEEWKKRRKEILLIRNKCEWCFRTQNLHIAHKNMLRNIHLLTQNIYYVWIKIFEFYVQDVI